MILFDTFKVLDILRLKWTQLSWLCSNYKSAPTWISWIFFKSVLLNCNFHFSYHTEPYDVHNVHRFRYHRWCENKVKIVNFMTKSTLFDIIKHNLAKKNCQNKTRQSRPTTVYQTRVIPKEFWLKTYHIHITTYWPNI